MTIDINVVVSRLYVAFMSLSYDKKMTEPMRMILSNEIEALVEALAKHENLTRADFSELVDRTLDNVKKNIDPDNSNPGLVKKTVDSLNKKVIAAKKDLLDNTFDMHVKIDNTRIKELADEQLLSIKKNIDIYKNQKKNKPGKNAEPKNNKVKKTKKKEMEDDVEGFMKMYEIDPAILYNEFIERKKAEFNNAPDSQTQEDIKIQIDKYLSENIKNENLKKDKVYIRSITSWLMEGTRLTWNAGTELLHVSDDSDSNAEEKELAGPTSPHISEQIQSHGNLRTQFFWITLQAVHNSALSIAQGHTAMQIGRKKTPGSPYSAAHSAFFPSLVQEQTLDPIFNFKFRLTSSMTHLVPHIVNSYLDKNIEDDLRVKLLDIINEVSSGKMQPKQGMFEYFTLLKKYIEEKLTEKIRTNNGFTDDEKKDMLDMLSFLKKGLLTGFPNETIDDAYFEQLSRTHLLSQDTYSSILSHSQQQPAQNDPEDEKPHSPQA